MERGRLLDQARASWAPFAAVAVQFGLIVLLLGYWHLENLAVGRVMQLAFVGFLIHHLLPIRFRLPFFAGLSVVATVMVLGQMGPGTLMGLFNGRVSGVEFLRRLIPGVSLVGIGLGLIGICHLPIRLAARVGLLVVVGAGLAVLRSQAQWFPQGAALWPILGSMFAFRLMIYLYDLQHRAAPFSPARAVSYCFMLPNVCFPLFPLVDYKTFCATYYNEDWPRVYQSGLRWMVRGVFHLLLYRLVYRYAALDVSNLSSTLDVVSFMVGTYLLYLRVSGEFHLIVGLLHMFGFNLPETHHLYLLASSFTDFWRRINIYWKDFIMKLFFYPVYFAVRRLGTLQAMSLATAIAFVATWLLHSWQWFWIRGSFLFTWQDISFWTVLAALVLGNALYEAKTTRKRTLSPSRVTMAERVRLGLQTIGTFVVICTIWTVWSSQSLAELQVLADAASRPRLSELAIIVAGLAGIGVCGMLWGRSSRETSEGRLAPAARAPFDFWRSAATVGATAIVLLSIPALLTAGLPASGTVIGQLRNDGLNVRDANLQRRGYYEELDLARANTERWRNDETPEGWLDARDLLYRDRPDFLMQEVVPSVTAVFAGARTTTNPLGMRDRPYDKVKAATTHRSLLLGDSHAFGTGVNDDETFENLVEDRLNQQRPDPRFSRYEILNLSAGGTSLFQRLLRLDQSGFELKPDLAMLCVCSVEERFVLRHLSKALRQELQPPPGYDEFLTEVYRKAGVHAGLPDLVIQRRLAPHVPDIYRWLFHRFAEQCQQHGVQPLVLYRPAPVDSQGIEEARRLEMIELASEAGLGVIDLSPAFETVADRGSLTLAKWDDHTNALGHRLLAETLYQALVPRLFPRIVSGSAANL